MRGDLALQACAALALTVAIERLEAVRSKKPAHGTGMLLQHTRDE
jgi:hypothetical protein